MEPNLFKYVWQHSRKDQVWLLIVVLVSMIPYFLSFDLPKQIVNGPIQGRDFPVADSTATFLPIAFDVPAWIDASGRLELFSGFDLERIPYLVALSMLFLALVCINGMFKFYINTYKGRLGERMLRRLRFQLIDRVLRFPLRAFRRLKAPEVATMIKDEVEPLGEFIGDAFIQPVFLGSQALTAMVFIMVQNFWLGLIAAAIVAIQAVIIPRMRRQLVALGKQRQLTARKLAGRVGEIVDGMTEIRTNDASNYERADISYRLGHIFFIRYELFKKKFLIKFLNNFLSQFTPFLFYFIGGYFAIRGSLDIGQLVAVIAAYKDLPPPIRELINWDQQRMNVQVKYAQVIEQFQSEPVLASELQPIGKDAPARLAGEVAAQNVTAIDDTGVTLLDGLTFKIALNATTALVGAQNSGAATVAELVSRIVTPNNGRIFLGAENLTELPEAVAGRRVAYVGPESYFRQESIRDALLYGLKRYPQAAPEHRELFEGLNVTPAMLTFETQRSGNSSLDPRADWVDYATAGVANEPELAKRINELLSQVQLDEDVFELGLRGRIDPDMSPDVASRVLEARSALRQRLTRPPLQGLVEHLDPDAYNSQVDVAGNLLFGTASDGAALREQVTAHAHARKVLADLQLDEELFEMGRQIADTVIELFAGLAPEHPFFQQLSFIDAEELPDYKLLLARVAATDFAGARDDDRMKLLRLAFAYVEPKLRLGLLDDALRARIVAARRAFHENLPADLSEQLVFYDDETYNRGATLEENILFGRIAHGVAEGSRRVREAMRAVLGDLNLRDTVIRVGLDFDVGTGGRRLSAQQRQRLALARALLKRPDYLILNQSFSGFDMATQEKLADLVLKLSRGDGGTNGFGVLWTLTNAALARRFETVLVLEEGRVAEQGDPQKLASGSGPFSALARAWQGPAGQGAEAGSGDHGKYQ